MSRPILVISCLLVVCACTPQGDPAVGANGFTDDFERAQLGELWNNTGGPWEIRDGALHIRGARNKPLWLRRTLPRDARIEFDVRSTSDEGDIKVEVFGDGVSKATSDSYTATSYVIIFGGWGNTINAVARMNEHGTDRADGPSNPVEVGRTYRMKIERRGNTVTVWADDTQLAEMVDEHPLEGRGHDHFGFNNWQSDLTFDNLSITAL